MNIDDVKGWNETLCSTCNEKPGTPTLCTSCIENRNKIWDLKALAQALFDELGKQKKNAKEQREGIVNLSTKISEMKIRERALQDTIVHIARANEGGKE